MINPGELKHRISFYTTAETVDNEGFKSASQVLLFTTKCKILENKKKDPTKSATKSIDSKKVTMTIVIRYTDSIDIHCIADFQGKKFRVETIEDIDYENRFLKVDLIDG